MLRHDFQPGKLVAGVVLTVTAVAFGGDARGLWTVPWVIVVPLICGGLCLAGAVGTVGHMLQYRRRRARASGHRTAGHVTAGAATAGESGDRGGYGGPD